MAEVKQLKFILRLICLVSFSIVNCQLSNCSKNPCKNGAKCMDQPGTSYGYSCSCITPFMGVNCDQSPGNKDFMNSYPNNNNNNNNVPNSNVIPQNNWNSNNQNNWNNNQIFGAGGNNIGDLSSQGLSNNVNPGNPGLNTPNFWNKPTNQGFDANANSGTLLNSNNINTGGFNNLPGNGINNLGTNYNPLAWNNNQNQNALPPFGSNNNRLTTQVINVGNGALNQINGCSSSPCLNGGSCNPYGPWGFKCQCAQNYYGFRCERYYVAQYYNQANVSKYQFKTIWLLIFAVVKI